MRSLLTVLAVIVGVATVVTVASILQAVRGEIVSQIEQYGTDKVWAFHLSGPATPGTEPPAERHRKPLTLADSRALQTLGRSIADVAYTGFPQQLDTWLQYRQHRYLRAQVQGVSSNLAMLHQLGLRQGRFLSQADDLHRRKVCVLGKNVVEALFDPQTTVPGRTIRLGGHLFIVVGVLETRRASLLATSPEDASVYLPYRTLRKIDLGADALLLSIKAKPGQLQQAREETESILRRLRGLRADQPNDFELSVAPGLIEEFDSVTATVHWLALLISSVGLVVGGIGITNMMLVSVTERTREIGIRKAVGACNRDIGYQFLFEALMLTGLGGVLGILLAGFVRWTLLGWLPALAPGVPVGASVEGLGIALLVGVVFGVGPALKAARKPPLQCLYYG